MLQLLCKTQKMSDTNLPLCILSVLFILCMFVLLIVLCMKYNSAVGPKIILWAMEIGNGMYTEYNNDNHHIL